MEPFENDAANIYALKAIFQERGPQRKDTYSVNQPETIEPGLLLIVYQANLRDLVNAEVERQVTHRIQDPIAIAVEGIVVDATQLGMDFTAPHKQSDLDRFTDTLISRTIQSGRSDSFSDTCLRSLAVLIMSMDSIIRRVLKRQSFQAPVLQLVKIIVRDRALV